MSKLQEIHLSVPNLPYMNETQSDVMSQIINNNEFESILELGTYQGKGTLCMAAICEDRGVGHVTTMDRSFTSTLKPGLAKLAKRFKLNKRITQIVGQVSYMWDLNKLIKDNKQFDLCYIDTAHIFETTALSFYLADEMMSAGSIVIFDDVNWIPRLHDSGVFTDTSNPQYMALLSDEELDTPAVDTVANLVQSKSNYTEISDQFPIVCPQFWRIFRKDI